MHFVSRSAFRRGRQLCHESLLLLRVLSVLGRRFGRVEVVCLERREAGLDRHRLLTGNTVLDCLLQFCDSTLPQPHRVSHTEERRNGEREYLQGGLPVLMGRGGHANRHEGINSGVLDRSIHPSRGTHRDPHHRHMGRNRTLRRSRGDAMASGKAVSVHVPCSPSRRTCARGF